MIEKFRDQQAGEGSKQKAVNRHGEHKWWNVAMMSLCWIASGYSYDLFIFLIKYLPANIYVVDIVAGLSAIGFLV